MGSQFLYKYATIHPKVIQNKMLENVNLLLKPEVSSCCTLQPQTARDIVQQLIILSVY